MHRLDGAAHVEISHSATPPRPSRSTRLHGFAKQVHEDDIEQPVNDGVEAEGASSEFVVHQRHSDRDRAQRGVAFRPNDVPRWELAEQRMHRVVPELVGPADHEHGIGVSSRTICAGVEIDLNMGAGLEAALDGADQLFLLSPPGRADQDAVLIPVIERAAARGLHKVVLMTAMGADAADTPLRRAELALKHSGPAWNVVRPNWFMQNVETFWLSDIRDRGAIRLPVGGGRASFIDAKDIARVAAELLTRDDFAGRAFDLTGPAALDHAEVAAILSKVTGRSIRFENISPDVMRESLLGVGVPGPFAEFMLIILEALKAGHAERTTNAMLEVTGRAPGTFEAYVAERREPWIG